MDMISAEEILVLISYSTIKIHLEPSVHEQSILFQRIQVRCLSGCWKRHRKITHKLERELGESSFVFLVVYSYAALVFCGRFQGNHRSLIWSTMIGVQVFICSVIILNQSYRNVYSWKNREGSIGDIVLEEEEKKTWILPAFYILKIYDKR